MAKTTEEQKTEIEQKIEKLRMKAKMIKNREARNKAKQFTQIGRLAFRADIGGLPEDVLLGAFLEIKERSHDESVVLSWEKRTAENKRTQQSQTNTPIVVSFATTPEKQTREVMTNLGFKWNSFRQEYYGYEKVESIEEHLAGIDCKIEIVN